MNRRSATVLLALVVATASGHTPALAQDAAGLPGHLSVAGMFMAADWIVKSVMVGLLVASVVTWTIFIAKLRELLQATRHQRAVHDGVIGLRSLGDADGKVAVADCPLVAEARSEIRLSADAIADADGIKERVVSRFERLEAAQARRMTRGINILATIGSTAPFVGLFGTVWGIMNAFIGIAEKQTTNLAVVAPGIAEALLATALGLVAAIPSVVIYNHFSRQIAAHRALVSDTAAAVLRLVSRDLSRGKVGV